MDGVCEVQILGDDRAPGTNPGLLIEIPHGAVSRDEFDALHRRLRGPFPDDLAAFFFVNTDVGAPEVGRHVATRLAADGVRVLLLRSRIPRVFVDCNRVVDGEAGPGLTPGLPQYVTDAEDAALLRGLHRRYQAAADLAYETVCGAGGLALALHTYAPRSVRITTLDSQIVAALRAAYEPEAYAQWEVRPQVEVISRTDDGQLLGPEDLIRELRERYAAADIEVQENVTYRAHAGSLGHRYGARYPGRVLCVELNRSLLADPFTPFEPMTIGVPNVERMAAPLEAALAQGILARRR